MKFIDQTLSKLNTSDLSYILHIVLCIFFYRMTTGYLISVRPEFVFFYDFILISGLFALVVMHMYGFLHSGWEYRINRNLLNSFLDLLMVISTGFLLSTYFYENFLEASSEFMPFITFFSGITVIVLTCFFAYKNSTQVQFKAGGSEHCTAVGVSARLIEKTPKDMKNIAAHEAGHALLFSALGALPDDFEINIKHDAADGGLGYVRGLTNKTALSYPGYTHWLMLVYQAGTSAEKHLCNERSLGSASDQRLWQSQAIKYFENQTSIVYYHRPTNEVELRNNANLLTALMEEHVTILDDFFTLNQEVLSELSERLLSNKVLQKESLTDLFRKVRFQDNFPFPMTPFSEFSTDWSSVWAQYTQQTGLTDTPAKTL